MVWAWRNERGDLFLSASEPKVAAEDDLWHGIKAGDIVGPIDTVVVRPVPEGLEPTLPSGKEVRQMLFHEELWGDAQELPSYDKKLWTELAAKLKQ